MSLKDWANNGWLRSHTSNIQEIQNLLEIVERDLKDARQKTLSADWRFGIAYNASFFIASKAICQDISSTYIISNESFLPGNEGMINVKYTPNPATWPSGPGVATRWHLSGPPLHPPPWACG